MRFEVPQFIEIEDKIFGPFTWRQFVYLAGGIGLAVVLLFVAPIIVFMLIGIPIGGLAILLAFYPVNNRPFSNYLESIVHFYNNNRIYHWHKKSTVVYKGRVSTTPQIPLSSMTRTQAGSISTLARRLELNALEKK